MIKICKPYTYAIGWSKHGVWYYGVRTSKSSYVGDIMIKYFTSSSLVKEFIHTNGPPNIIKVTRIFESVEEAIEHEHKFLKRVRCDVNPKFINAHYAKAFMKFEKNPMKMKRLGRKCKEPEFFKSL